MIGLPIRAETLVLLNAVLIDLDVQNSSYRTKNFYAERDKAATLEQRLCRR